MLVNTGLRYNDYWIVDIESYRLAYEAISIDHNFSRILLIDYYGQVNVLSQT